MSSDPISKSYEADGYKVHLQNNWELDRVDIRILRREGTYSRVFGPNGQQEMVRQGGLITIEPTLSVPRDLIPILAAALHSSAPSEPKLVETLEKILEREQDRLDKFIERAATS